MFKKILVSGLCAVFAGSLFATDDLYAPDLPQVWSSIITVSGGPVWTNPGKNQYLYPFPAPRNNYYVAHSESDILGSGELFFGLQHFIGDSNIIGQLGLGAAGASNALLSGVVDVDGIPDVYTYRYNISHIRLEFKGKLIANGFQPVQPYLSSSFGVAWNHSHGYFPTTIDPILFPTYWFSKTSVVGFTYTVGLGIQKMLTPNWQVGVGYEFADWGQNYLGSDGNTLNRGPGTSHLYTNELLFSISYMF